MSEELKNKSLPADEGERIATAAQQPRNDNTAPGHSEGGLPPVGIRKSERSEDKLKTHFASLREQAEELRKEFPDFRLSEALKDESFIRMTAPAVGVDLRRAYFAMNREKLESMAERRGAEAAREAFAKSLRDNAARPVEGGSSAAAELRTDYRAMSGKSRAELKRQIRDAAARGKKIYP